MRRYCVAFYLIALTFLALMAACSSSNSFTVKLPAGVTTSIDAGSGGITLTANGGASGTVTFTITAGAGCGTLTPETATTVLYNPPAASLGTSCTVTITATDSSGKKTTITLTINAITVSNGTTTGGTVDEGAAPVNLTVTLNNLLSSLDGTVTVTWTLTPTQAAGGKGSKSAKANIIAAGCGTLTSGSTSSTTSVVAPVVAGSAANTGTSTVQFTSPNPTNGCTATITATASINGASDSTTPLDYTIAPIGIAITTPATSPVNVNEGAMQSLAANLTNDGSATPEVTWALSPLTGCGSLSSTAPVAKPWTVTYTAPTTACTVTATATSVTDSTKAASVVLNATPPVISVSLPPTYTMDASNGKGSSTLPIVATIQNDVSGQGVSYTITPPSNANCGSFLTPSSASSQPFTAALDSNAASGLAVGTPCVTTITATSNADHTKSATTALTVEPITVSISPGPSETYQTSGSPTTFNATASDDALGAPANNAYGVSWGLSNTSCGTLSNITTTSVSFTPGSTACTTDLTATSIADGTKSNFDTITVTVAVTPTLTFNLSNTSYYAVVGQPYQIALDTTEAIGGTPPYSYSTYAGSGAPPSGLTTYSDSTTFNSLLGTPTAATAAGTPDTFQIEVTDSSTPPKFGISQTVSVTVAPAPSGNNAKLSGQYTCLVKGFIDNPGTNYNSQPFPFAAVSSLTLDGAGGITGSYDTAYYDGSNDAQSGQDITGTVKSGGFYTLDNTNHGIASYTGITSKGTNTFNWAIVANNIGNGSVATQFHAIQIDDLEPNPSGIRDEAECYLATPADFTAANIGGSFVFSNSGVGNDGTPVTTVGVLALANNAVTSASTKFDEYSTAFDEDFTVTGITGSYTVPSPIPASGRFAVQLNTTVDSVPIDFQTIIYPIDTDRAVALNTALPSASTAGLMSAGNVRRQLESSYSNANLSGPVVLYFHGAEVSGTAVSNYIAELLQGTGDGATGITFRVNEQDIAAAGASCNDTCTLTTGSTGTLKPVAFSSNGRATAGGSSGTETIYLYFYDTDAAVLMDTDPSLNGVGIGWVEKQTATTSSNAAGNYMQTEMFPANTTGDDKQGLFTFTGATSTTGTISGVQDDSNEDSLQYAQPLTPSGGTTPTYAGPETYDVINIANAGNQTECVMITTIKTVCISASSNPNLTALQQ